MNALWLAENIRTGLYILHEPTHIYRRVCAFRQETDGGILLQLAQSIKHKDETFYMVNAAECRRAYTAEQLLFC